MNKKEKLAAYEAIDKDPECLNAYIDTLEKELEESEERLREIIRREREDLLCDILGYIEFLGCGDICEDIRKEFNYDNE